MKKIYNNINLFFDKMVKKLIMDDSLFFKTWIIEMILIGLSFYYVRHLFLNLCFSVPVLIYSSIFLYKKNKFKK